MKRMYIKLLSILLLLIQCSSPAQKETEKPLTDTVVTTIEMSEEMRAKADEEIDEDTGEEEESPSGYITDTGYSYMIDLEAFAKNPFPSDYPYIKNFLRETGIAFTILAEDTIHSEHRVIEFRNSRIDFLDSDERFQEELGDLICSSDISSGQFQFNQDVSIGMTKEDVLLRTGLNESSLEKDESSGLQYYEKKVFWGEDEGYWKVTLWFNAGTLVRIQSEISPCYYDYGD